MTLKTPNRVYQYTSTTGTGDVILDGSAVFPSFFTADEVGFVVGDEPVALIEEGDDCEVSEVTITSTSPLTFSRDTVKSSRISGVAGTSKMSLSGSATVQFVAEGNNLVATASRFGALENGYLEASVAGNALTVSVKALDGTDPSQGNAVYVWVRSSSEADGSLTRVAITSALSITASSGSTMGTTNAEAFKLWVVVFNDGGTLRLGLINCRYSYSIYPLSQDGIASSTAEGGAGGADSAQVFYTGSAVSSKAYATLGYLTWASGLTTAGTWDTAPSKVQQFGPGVTLPGRLVQSVYQVYTTYGSTGTTIPNDDTIPQSSEGTQLITATITPVDAANVLALKAHVDGTVSSGAWILAAIFRDSAANAIAMGRNYQGTVNATAQVNIDWRVLADAATATTFKLRAGPGTGSVTVYFNGTSAGRIGGGTLHSFITISELQS